MDESYGLQTFQKLIQGPEGPMEPWATNEGEVPVTFPSLIKYGRQTSHACLAIYSAMLLDFPEYLMQAMLIRRIHFIRHQRKHLTSQLLCEVAAYFISLLLISYGTILQMKMG